MLLIINQSLILADNDSDEKQLLLLHQQVLDAHKNINLEKWLNGFTDNYVSANRGLISYPSAQEMKERFRPYIHSTKFEYYRDMVSPVVKISGDKTLAWVIVQVEARGKRGKENYEFQSAWIELYEKQSGKWVNIGNVSNMKS